MPELSELQAALEDLRSQRERLSDLAGIVDRDGGSLIIRGREREYPIPVRELVYAEAAGGRVRFVLRSGRVVESNTAYSLDRVLDELEAYPQVARVHQLHLVNLNHLQGIGPNPGDSRGNILYMGDERQPIRMKAAYAKAVRRFFNLKTLEHVVPWNERYQAILNENLRSFETDIRDFPEERIREEFRYSTTGELHVRQLIANIIWQYLEWLKLPEEEVRRAEPIDGNIRTFWYYLKPLMSRLGVLDAGKQYEIMLDVFNKFVSVHRLFQYQDFGFVDEGASYRRLGDRLPHVVLVAEKTGHYRKLEKLQAEFGFTIMALGGSPSMLSVEYFLSELSAVVDFKQVPLQLISLVDFDPSGDIIFSSFQKHLRRFGASRYTQVDILRPERFTPDELAGIVFEVPQNTAGDRKKTKKWLERGGGIDGKPMGIECEALILNSSRLRQIVAQLLEEVQVQPAPDAMAIEDPLEAWELPELFSAEWLETGEEAFWRSWAKKRAAPRK